MAVIGLILTATSSDAASSEDQMTSLRLTHVLYAALLDHYAEDGRSKYRPDFLLHETYFRTFLHEWSLELDKGTAKSTREIWKTIAARGSYLGENYDIWRRLQPVAFNQKDRIINLGYRREAFLYGVLTSESVADFQSRSKLLYTDVARNLMTEPADAKLGLKILTAFSKHPSIDLQQQAADIIRRHPAFSRTIQIAMLTRDLAIGFGVARTNLASRVAGAIGAGGRTALAVGQSVKNRVRTAIRFPELIAIWKRSSLTRAYAASLGLHGGAAAALAVKDHSFELSQFAWSDPEVVAAYENSSPVSFLMALSLNTASDRPTASLERTNFVVPRIAKSFETEAAWINAVRSTLASWNRTDVFPASANFANLILEGERIMDLWPRDQTLARVTFQSRLEQMHSRLKESQISEVEDLRKAVLTNELLEYRRDAPTFASLLLDWGGNCISQTLTFVALFTQRPDLIPAGQQLGVFVSPDHMEAVLLSDDKIEFLVSGERVKRVQSMTILKPQALLQMALANAGAGAGADLRPYYISGMPDSIRDTSQMGSIRAILGRLTGFGSGNGILGVASGFKALGRATDGEIPEYAKVGYQAFHIGSYAGFTGLESFRTSFYESLKDRSDLEEKPREIKKVKVPLTIVPSANGAIEAALYEANQDPYVEHVVRFSKKLSSKAHSVSRYFNDGSSFDFSYDLTKPNAIKQFTGRNIAPDKFRTLMSIPKNLWVWQITRWSLEEIAPSFGAKDISEAAVARASKLEINQSDIAFLQLQYYGWSWQGRSTRSRAPGIDDRFAYEMQAVGEFLKAMVPALSDRTNPAPEHNIKTPKLSTARSELDKLSGLMGRYEQQLGRELSELPNYSVLKRSDPLAKLRMRFQFNDVILAKAEGDSAGFIKAFAKLDSRVKIALVVAARRKPGATDYFPSQLLKLRNDLDLVRPGQITQEEPFKVSGRRTSPPNITSPLCKSEDGCKAFVVLDKGERSQSASGGGYGQDNEDSGASRKMRISSADLALLSLMTSGGLQLWDKRTFAAVDNNASTWIKEIGFQEFYNEKAAAIWSNLNASRAGQPYVKRATEAFITKLPPLTMPVSEVQRTLRLYLRELVNSRDHTGSRESYEIERLIHYIEAMSDADEEELRAIDMERLRQRIDVLLYVR